MASTVGAMWEEGNIGVGSSIPRTDQIAADFPLWVWPMGVLETSGQNCTAKYRRQWLSESGSLVMRSSLVRQLNHGVPYPLPHRSSGNHMQVFQYLEGNFPHLNHSSVLVPPHSNVEFSSGINLELLPIVSTSSDLSRFQNSPG